MATLIFGSGSGGGDDRPGAFGIGLLGSVGFSQILPDYAVSTSPLAPGHELLLGGTGFTRGAAGQLAGGTINEVQVASPGAWLPLGLAPRGEVPPDPGFVLDLSGISLPVATLDAWIAANDTSGALTSVLGGATIRGTSGADVLQAFGGTTDIYGGGGDDTLIGSAGTTFFHLSTGNVTVQGGAGDNIAVFGGRTLAGMGIATAGGSVIVTGSQLKATLSSVQTLAFTDGTLSFDPRSPGGQAYRLYLATLGRRPDAGGLGYWANSLQNDPGSLPAVAQGFMNSAEFQARYGQLDAAGFVSALYQNVLGRAPDSGGLAYWQNVLAGGASRAQVVAGFSESVEFVQQTAYPFAAGLWAASPDATEVLRVYEAAFGRAPANAELDYWAPLLAGGFGTARFEAAVLQSQEFQAEAGVQSDTGFVGRIETNAYGAADPAATSYWASLLGAGTASRAAVLDAYAFSPGMDAKVAPLITHGVA